MSASRAASSTALVLDFGGVISRTLFETHSQSEKALGLPAGTLNWRGPFDAASDSLWCDMQAGRISERDYWLRRSQEVGRLLGEDWNDMQTLVLRARGAEPDAIVRPEAIDAVKTAKAMGCRVAILSNELDLFYGVQLRERLSLMRDVDVIVDATYTGILKPDPRAYALCESELQLPPQALVLVDDQLRNIEGAQRAGWHTAHLDVREPATAFAHALELLRKLGSDYI